MKSGLGKEPLRRFRRHDHLALVGETQDRVYRLEEGWACRYTLLPDGRRQITALYLPGDFCEPQWVLSGRAELPIVALTDVIATEIPLGSIRNSGDEGVSELIDALMTNFNRQSDWIVSLGRRSATGRITALFTEIYSRLQHNGRVRQPCTIPLTQQDIADVVGLTPVHVNRVVSEMRRQGLIQFSGKTIIVPRPDEITGQHAGVGLAG